MRNKRRKNDEKKKERKKERDICEKEKKYEYV
jgi:hypothetical protein